MKGDVGATHVHKVVERREKRGYFSSGGVAS
jgi:hypothetical protein